MSSKTVVKLDAKDRKLLYELDMDSRRPAAQLARKVGISKQGCTFKINNMQKKGVITSFPTVMDIALMGYLSFRLYFKLIDITPEEEEEFRQYMIGHKDIAWLVGCEGTWDYIIVVFPQDFESFEKFSAEFNNRFGRFIEKKDIALVTAAYHFRCGYLLGEKSDIPPMVYAGQPKRTVRLDDAEKSILALLSGNARMPLVELSRALSISPKNAAYRIGKLEKMDVIEGFTVATDLEKLGFERYKVFLRTKNMMEDGEKAFIQYARKHPYVLYYSKSIGANDVELELIVNDSVHLREIIADIRKRFGGIIKSYEILRIYREFKLNYYPSGSVTALARPRGALKTQA
jgi:DNA-binding Lrp family transcriptional regulator